MRRLGRTAASCALTLTPSSSVVAAFETAMRPPRGEVRITTSMTHRGEMKGCCQWSSAHRGGVHPVSDSCVGGALPMSVIGVIAAATTGLGDVSTDIIRQARVARIRAYSPTLWGLKQAKTYRTSSVMRRATSWDTFANRQLIQGIIKPENSPFVKYLADGSSLTTYRSTLPNGSQIWAEVRNGEITNAGINAIPR